MQYCVNAKKSLSETSRTTHLLRHVMPIPAKLYVNYEPYGLETVRTANCATVFDFRNAVKEAYPNLLKGVDGAQIRLHPTKDGEAFPGFFSMENITAGVDPHYPIYATVITAGTLRFNTNRFCLHSLASVAGTRACSNCFTFLFADCVWFCIALFLRFPP